MAKYDYERTEHGYQIRAPYAPPREYIAFAPTRYAAEKIVAALNALESKPVAP